MNKNTAIQIENLSKRYKIGSNNTSSLRHTLSSIFKNNITEEFWALKDINLNINKGDAIGIIGRNGAGKSTLLKILSKITYPTTGKITLNGKVASLLEVGTGFHHELTGRENIYLNGSLLGMTRGEIKDNLDEIIDFSGVEKFIDTPVKHYSSGMYVRLAFSVAAHLRSDILLVDEVLAVGDIEFQKKCLRRMNEIGDSTGKTVVLVSHNMQHIDTVCNKVITLDGGLLVPNNISFEEKTYKKYINNPLQEISIKQKGDKIILEGTYSFKQKSNIPNLGFECRSMKNEYIFSYNLLIEGSKFLNQEYPISGKVRYIINSPILQDGMYSFLIYFGDGKRDVLKDKEGLIVSISNMAEFNNNQAYVLPQISVDVS